MRDESIKNRKFVLFHIINYVSDEDAEEFDKAFPPKEKLKLPGQIF